MELCSLTQGGFRAEGRLEETPHTLHMARIEPGLVMFAEVMGCAYLLINSRRRGYLPFAQAYKYVLQINWPQVQPGPGTTAVLPLWFCVSLMTIDDVFPLGRIEQLEEATNKGGKEGGGGGNFCVFRIISET